MLPPVMKLVRDCEEKGYKAEYEIFMNTIRPLELPMYVFYSLRLLGKKDDELCDFLIVMKDKIIALEVKAFKLVANPTPQNISRFEEVLTTSFNQHLKLKNQLKEFLKNHGFSGRFNGSFEIPLLTYTVLPNASRGDHHSRIGDSRITADMKENILYKGELTTKLESLSQEEVTTVDSDKEHALRTLLAWFYGLYCFDEIGGELSKENEYSVRKEVDRPLRHTNRQVAGVFLTPAQKEIIDSDEDFLYIIGKPGTGKTYCLIAKMVKLFKEAVEKWKKTGNMETGIILYTHRSHSTVEWIQGLFQATIHPYLEENPEVGSRVTDFIEFKEFTAHWSLFETYTGLKLFVDDVDSHSYPFEIDDIWLSGVKFLWCATGRAKKVRRSFRSIQRIEDDITYWEEKVVYLEQALRSSNHITQFAMGTENILPPYGTDEGENGLREPEYKATSRVIGDQVDFHLVYNKTELPVKMAEILPKFLNQFPPNSIWVLCQYGYEINLVVDDCERLGVGCYKYEDKIGQEVDCIILLADRHPERSFLLNAATRAISRLIVLGVAVYEDSRIIYRDMSCKNNAPQLLGAGKRFSQTLAKSKDSVVSLRTRILPLTDYEISPLFLLSGCKRCGDKCVEKWGFSSTCVKQSFAKLYKVNSPTVPFLERHWHYERIAQYLFQIFGKQILCNRNIDALLTLPLCGYPSFTEWLSVLEIAECKEYAEEYDEYMKKVVIIKLRKRREWVKKGSAPLQEIYKILELYRERLEVLKCRFPQASDHPRRCKCCEYLEVSSDTEFSEED